MRKSSKISCFGGLLSKEISETLNVQELSFDDENSSVLELVDSVKTNLTNIKFRPSKSDTDTTKKPRNSKNQKLKNDLIMAIEWNNNSEKPKMNTLVKTETFDFVVSCTETDEFGQPKIRATKESLDRLGVKRKTFNAQLKQQKALRQISKTEWVKHDSVLCQAHKKTVVSQQDFFKRC